MAADLTLRPATEADAELVWTCRQELEGTNAVQSAMPDYAGHCAWMARAVRAPGNLFLIGEQDGTGGRAGVGYVRIDALEDGSGEGAGWRVSIGLLAAMQGRGLGRAALEAGCARAEAQGLTPLFADIHRDNPASRRIFEACGFAPVPGEQAGADGFRRFRRPAARMTA